MDAAEKQEIRDLVREAVDEAVAPLAARVGDLEKTHKDLATQVHANTEILAKHAELHTGHARLITTAQELALQALQKTDGARAEQDAALKSAIEIQNKAITAVAAQGEERAKKLDAVAAISVGVASEMGVAIPDELKPKDGPASKPSGPLAMIKRENRGGVALAAFTFLVNITYLLLELLKRH